MSATLSRSALASAFARTFLIQGSWNYHTMIGSGFAFAMLPGLRRLYGRDPEQLDAAVQRHLEHFNAHPYLAGVALGAALRMEAEGEEADTVRRFKQAVRSPLGVLGDALVWATWLPGVSVASLALFWLGLEPWLVVAFFLASYNLGHLALRAWGFRAGWRDGREVGGRLAGADLSGWTARLQPLVVGLLGALLGAILGGTGGLAEAGPAWAGAALGAFVAGLAIGHAAWRPAAAAVVVAVGLSALWGVAR